MRDLDASLAREVAVELELLLQLQSLVARVGLAAAPTLRRVGSCTQHATQVVNSTALRPDLQNILRFTVRLSYVYRKIDFR